MSGRREAVGMVSRVMIWNGTVWEFLGYESWARKRAFCTELYGRECLERWIYDVMNVLI